MVRREAGNHPTDSVYILQSFDATALRGKLVRYRASLRLQTTLSVAQIFVRVDRPSGVGFSEYSPIQASRSTGWTTLEVGGPIDEDAKRITIGLVYRGLGSAYFADAEFETFDNHL
jgi:hypothetical protein